MVPVSKKERYQIKIDSVASDGSGVGHIQGFTVFVPMSVTGDIAEVEITKVKRRFAYGKLIRIIEPSKERQKPKCPYFTICGGCQLQHIEYQSQAREKKRIIEDAIKRIGGISDFSLDKFIAADNPFRYRNKVVFQSNGKDCGFFEQHSRNIINTHDCLLCNEDLIRVKTAAQRYIAECGARVKRIFARRTSLGEVMAVISADSRNIPYPDRLIEYLKRVDNIKSVYLNIDKSSSSTLMRGEYTLLWGRERLCEEILGVKFTVSPQSFFQINYEQMKKLYQTAISYADISETDTVMDIYCGTGTISLIAAKNAKSVIGIEKVEEAILDAQANAKMNGIANAEFYPFAAADIVPKMTDRKIDIVILDPPRAGSDEETLGAILKMSPKRIVYISCDPSTLARDTKFLSNGGYSVTASTGVDMFPQTAHVETVCLLSKLKSSEHINVELNMDELDLTAAEKKATYQEIKDYVLEHCGLKVSHLNIAQVKRKCGIIERENYNKPKNKNVKQPNCTPEKESAIMAALRHFGMI